MEKHRYNSWVYDFHRDRQKEIDMEKRAAAWDAYAGQPIEFTVGGAFNAGYEAGQQAIFSELERLRAMESAVREIYPNRHEMFDTEDDSAPIRFHRRIMELGKFMSQQCFDEYQTRNVEADNTRLREKYNELLLAVASKYPDETRHETALRYIREAETSKGEDGRSRQ